MGSGCNFWFAQRENGLKRVDLPLTGCLQDRRRVLLQTAREVCRKRELPIPDEELEAALIEGSWRRVLAPIDRTRRARHKVTTEPVWVYLDTLWDLDKFMETTMSIKGERGAMRAFYALLE